LRNRTLESAGREIVGYSQGSSQDAVIIALASALSVKLAFQPCRAQLQVQVNGARQTETVDDTCIEGSGIGMRTGISMSPAGADIRDDFIDAVRIVTTEKRVQVNHQISVQVHIVPSLFVGTVVSRTADDILGSLAG